MRQPEWTMSEAVILLDGYLEVMNGNIPKRRIIKQISMELRALAKNNHSRIDEVYRNENGIAFQMQRMESAYAGRKIYTPATKLFLATVEMYRNNRQQYEDILMKTRSKGNIQEETYQQFCRWLAIKAPKVQPDLLCRFLSIAEEFCLKIKVLSSPLFETTDEAVIRYFDKTVNQNKIFKIKNRKQINNIISAANWYYAFVRDLPNQASKDAPVETMLVVDAYEVGTNQNNIVDLNQMDEQKERKNEQEIPGISVNTDFDISFSDWLMNIENMADSTCRSYVSSLNSAESYAKKHNLANKNISGVDSEEALLTVSCLMADEGFRQINQDQHNRFSAAFQKLTKYFSYLHSNETSAGDAPAIHTTEKEKVGPRFNDASVELTSALSAFLKAYSEGSSKEDILAHFSAYSTQQINRSLAACCAVKVLKKYYHKESIYGFDEMADILLDVLTKQFAANGNYTSAQVLYNDAHLRLDDFFFYNNAFESRPEIFDLALYLFAQAQYKDNTFLFLNGTHIWKEEPTYPKDFHGLLIKYGREHNNIFSREEAIAYYNWIGSTSPDATFSNILYGVGNQTFLQYADNRFVLREALHINDNFLSSLRVQIDNLLESDDYIAFGEISDYFYTTLPSVPTNVQWSPLLIEDVLRIFDIGYISVEAGTDNDKKTIPAAILKKNSRFRTFADMVWNETFRAYSLPKEFTSSEFREFLLDRGFIHGSEKMWNVHKTVAGDLRFYWTEKNSKVTIN